MRVSKLAWCVLAVSLGVSSLWAGCRKSGLSSSSLGRDQLAHSIPAESDRFPHKLHTGSDPRIRTYKGRGLACVDCHPADAVQKGEVSRPGSNHHEPCDACHADEFYKPPGLFCQNCHRDVKPQVRGATTMQPYPERGFRRMLASTFSHAQHLDDNAMEGAVGFHVSCGDCHERDKEKREPMLPGHKQCAQCHEGKSNVKAVLPMNNCAKCHPQRDVELVRGRLLITGDLKFSHSTHVTDTAGEEIDCALCHDTVAKSSSAEEVSVPSMQRCAICHEDANRSPEEVRISRCEVCHDRIEAGRPPQNHLVGKGLPIDHTLEFRRNHGEQAAEQDANCNYCHDGVTGPPEQSCFQCHTTMRPRDHNLSWRDDAHGREAAAESERCAQCHEPDYCVACHTVPPRSHQPYAEFKLGGHADDARFDLRACFACHTFESTCSDCHRGIR